MSLTSDMNNCQINEILVYLFLPISKGRRPALAVTTKPLWPTLLTVYYLSTLSGAYGAAVLYRKRDDDSLVILKEINMHDLNAAERQLALNEVRKWNPERSIQSSV
jgi:hypothetical protein